MNELSISNVLANKDKYNLALPFMETRHINPFYKITVKELTVDVSESACQIFKVGGKKVGNNWIDMYSLTKTFILKLGTEAGIQFMPPNPGDILKIDDNTWQATAYGAIKLPDGSVSSTGDSKVIQLDAEEKKYKMQYEKKASDGIADYKAAQEAAKNYKGSWVETGEVNSNGYKVKKYVIDPTDRQSYINNSLNDAMAQLRVNAPQKAMTGAKLRVIRSLLAIKNAYTMEELKKPFVISVASFSPDYNDPFVKQFMLQQAAQSAVNLFGASTPQQITVTSTPTIDSQSEYDYEEFADDFDMNEPINEDTQTIQENQQNPNLQQSQELHEMPAGTNEFFCDKCGCDISEKVWKFSIDRYSRPLCYKCQRNAEVTG